MQGLGVDKVSKERVQKTSWVVIYITLILILTNKKDKMESLISNNCADNELSHLMINSLYDSNFKMISQADETNKWYTLNVIRRVKTNKEQKFNK